MSSESLEKERYEVINFKVLGNQTQIFIDSLNSLQHGCHSFVIDTLQQGASGTFILHIYQGTLLQEAEEKNLCQKFS